MPVLAVRDLAKTFRKSFAFAPSFPFVSARTIEAVRGISFEVERGEIFGLLGPNGAGKTTTFKMLTGLVAPTAGKATLFDLPLSHDSLRKVGFLPETPYVYPHLTPREFVALCARLSDVEGRGLPARVAGVLGRVEMSQAIDRPVRTLSKGMLQRVALASALVHEPELLVLDEPMDGLDPSGRMMVRELLREEKAKGRTILLSSHILRDIELLCDRICILRAGKVALEGAVPALLARHDGSRTEITLLADAKTEVIVATSEAEVADVLGRALARGARVMSVKRETLEELFVRGSNDAPS
ncbi:ABC transporter ATP-binding protein [Pendulispora albinea]|uniref:ABC transporter ATP-binding protein n=1 Tax=Pendulispora albinea TaxID=2741071 RepID=A0ABZ2LPN3_9BACT